MTRPSNFATAETARPAILEAPPEPVELKHRLRRRVLDRPGTWHGRAAKTGLFVDWAWEQWAPTLTAWGVTHSQLGDVVGGYRQELWLWLMGERTWAHTVEGLIGRVRRRTPTGRQAASSEARARRDTRGPGSRIPDEG